MEATTKRPSPHVSVTEISLSLFLMTLLRCQKPQQKSFTDFRNITVKVETKIPRPTSHSATTVSDSATSGSTANITEYFSGAGMVTATRNALKK
jgi:hypothetical protein